MLLPYFEVDTIRPDGVSTLFSIVNTSAEPTLVKITLWTTLGLPSLEFDVYLTGLDVFTSNLRDLFVDGTVPITGSEFSPQGDLSFPSLPFPGCEEGEIFGGTLPPSIRQAMIDFHAGLPSPLFSGACGAPLQDDGITRGYLTIDVVRRCSLQFPTEPGYFGPDGVASYENRLLGDVFYVDPANDFAHGENLVRLEADPDRFGPGDRTFYGAYVEGDGSDAREPLPSYWATRALFGGGFDGGTELTVWRGPTGLPEPFPCNQFPRLLPPNRQILSFDEEENILETFPGILPIIDPPPPPELAQPFPRAAARMNLQGTLFAPFDFGWLAMDLTTYRLPEFQPDPLSQAWVGTSLQASGRFNVGFSASPLSSPCTNEGCVSGESLEVAELCILGLPVPMATIPTAVLQPDTPLEFRLRPAGCFSSSCTQIFRANCSVLGLEGNTLDLNADFCVAEDRQAGAACTPDCNLGFDAVCNYFPGLPEGSYKATVDGLELSFQIPSGVPLDGLCVGAPF